MNKQQKQSEKIVSLFIMFFIILVLIAFALNELVIKNISAKEYVNIISTSNKGVQKIEIINDSRKVSFEWNYNNVKEDFTLILFKEKYDKYYERDRIASRDWTYYSGNWFEEIDEVEIIAKQLIYLAEIKNLSKKEEIEYFASFVQSLQSIKDTDDYPKFPYETLYELGGDCEDLSILLDRIFEVAKINSVIIEFDDHVGVGVEMEMESSGAFFKNNNKTYHYIETTSPEYKMGEIPEYLIDKGVKIYAKGKNALIFPEYKINHIVKNNETYYQMTMSLSNYGRNETTIEFSSFTNSNGNITKQYFREIKIKPKNTTTLRYNISEIEEHFKFIFQIKGREINDVSLTTKLI